MAKRQLPRSVENHRGHKIEDIKKQINDQNAHANIISAHATFRVGQTTDAVDLPFFDAEDEYFVRADLWLISSVAITLMDLFYGITKGVALETGRSVVEFRLGYANGIAGLAAESNALLDEIKGSDRYKTAMRKEQERSEAKAKLGDDTKNDTPPRPAKPKPTRL
jgi:hypothetical protein